MLENPVKDRRNSQEMKPGRQVRTLLIFTHLCPVVKM